MKRVLLYLSSALFVVSLCSFVIGKKISYKQKADYFEKCIGYSPYEVLLIYTKAHEGYSETWYPDGFVKGKQSYSIGYGTNNQGHKKTTDRIKCLFTLDGKRTNKELASLAIKDWFDLHKDKVKSKDIFEYTAGLLQIYNRGSYKILGACCGSKIPGICGSDNKDIKASHECRRDFELNIKNKNFKAVKKELQRCKDKLDSKK